MKVTFEGVGEAAKVSRVEFNAHEPVVHDQSSLWLKLLDLAFAKTLSLAGQIHRERFESAVRPHHPELWGMTDGEMIEDPELVAEDEAAQARVSSYQRLFLSARDQAQSGEGMVAFDGDDATLAYEALMWGVKARLELKTQSWGPEQAEADAVRVLSAIHSN